LHIIEVDEDGDFGAYPEATFICVFDRWLSQEDGYLLDEVKPSEWQKFEALSALLLDHFELQRVDPLSGFCHTIRSKRAREDIQTSCHADNPIRKKFKEFITLYIPELDCVYQEHFDYTNVLWHRAGTVPEVFLEFVEEVGLHHFSRKEGFARRAKP
jgi:hypothetical protein